MRYWVVLGILAAALGAAWAQPGPGTGQPAVAPVTPDNYDTLVNIADQVVLGTVTEVGREQTENGAALARATLRVDRVLKGMPGATAGFTYYLPPEPKLGQPAVAMFGVPIRLQAGDQRLFFLLRGRGGYTLPTIYFGNQPGAIQPAADVDKVAARLKAITVTATLTGALGPFYFDQPCTVTVTVRNTGAAPVQVLPPAVKGFFYSPRMENTVTFHTPAPPNAINGPVLMLNATAVGVPEIKTNHIIAQVGVDVALAPNGMNPPFDGGIRLPQWVTLAPGEEKTLPVTLLCGKPASWAVLAPDLYMLTVVNVCATVQVTLPADNGARNYNIITPWKDALVGSPLPKEAEALAKGE